MKCFADTFFWIAHFDAHDHWHGRAVAVLRSQPRIGIFTSKDCVIEFLNHFTERGLHLRMRAADYAKRVIPVIVRFVPRSPFAFDRALSLYADRPDKGYSLTDCLSMNAMKDLGLTHVLTRDVHFEQEGFVLALEG